MRKSKIKKIIISSIDISFKVYPHSAKSLKIKLINYLDRDFNYSKKRLCKVINKMYFSIYKRSGGMTNVVANSYNMILLKIKESK